MEVGVIIKKDRKLGVTDDREIQSREHATPLARTNLKLVWKRGMPWKRRKHRDLCLGDVVSWPLHSLPQSDAPNIWLVTRIMNILATPHCELQNKTTKEMKVISINSLIHTYRATFLNGDGKE